jgi:hypothetical protein
MTWREYEDAVFEECKRVFQFKEVKITKNVQIVGHISGTRRQIDVLVELLQEGEPYCTIVIECKHYAQKINIKTVDSFVGFLKDVGAQRGILVSEKGFTKGAINRAYKGEDDIVVDILSLGELQQFQAHGAIVYSGKNAITISPPFGWIVDGQQRGFAPAVFYRRGISSKEATEKENEWMYIKFKVKELENDTLGNLIKLQNESLMEVDDRTEIVLSEIDGLKVRKAFVPSYPVPEITVFREFDNFIAFVVLFCPVSYIDRDVRKIIDVFLDSIPICIQHDDNTRD